MAVELEHYDIVTVTAVVVGAGVRTHYGHVLPVDKAARPVKAGDRLVMRTRRYNGAATLRRRFVGHAPVEADALPVSLGFYGALREED